MIHEDIYRIVGKHNPSIVIEHVCSRENPNNIYYNVHVDGRTLSPKAVTELINYRAESKHRINLHIEYVSFK